MPPRSSRTSRSSRRSGRPGWPPSSGSAARLPADLPVLADAKRGDIGSTAARQAVALFDGLGADAVTVNPYLGAEAIAPLIERPDRFAYVLCRTSNPGAGELQDLVVAADPDAGFPAEPLHRRVARRAATWGPGGTVGLVVGGTAPAELAGIRSIVPGLAFLVPGVGAQGGEADAVLEHGVASAAPAGGRPGGGLLVNVSRGDREPAGDGRRRGSGRSPGAGRGSRRRVGSKAPCATLARAPDGPRASSRSDAAHTRYDLHRSTTMPNIGAPELIIILVIALLVLGPGKLPEVGKSIGQSIKEFRKASTDVQEGMNLDPTPAAPAAPAAAGRPPRSPRPRRRRGHAPAVAPEPVAAAPAASEPTASSN